MHTDNNKILNYLYKNFARTDNCSDFPSLFQPFSSCSRNTQNQKEMVTSTVKAINFDLLTNWLYKYKGDKPKSADALTFTLNDIFLIEFKSGDQVEKELNRNKLIKGATGKINGSDYTLCTDIISKVDEVDKNAVKFRFYLVVDAEAMGINILLQELVFRSKGSLPTGDEKIDALVNEVLPNMKEGICNPAHFKEIDIWFSELFDKYLNSYGIKDITVMMDGALSASR